MLLLLKLGFSHLMHTRPFCIRIRRYLYCILSFEDVNLAFTVANIGLPSSAMRR